MVSAIAVRSKVVLQQAGLHDSELRPAPPKADSQSYHPQQLRDSSPGFLGLAMGHGLRSLSGTSARRGPAATRLWADLVFSALGTASISAHLAHVSGSPPQSQQFLCMLVAA